MSKKEIDWEALAATFHKSDVKYRIQSMTKDGSKALLLPYVSSRSIMERLDRTPGIGPTNWKDEYEEWHKPMVPLDAATATVGGVAYNGNSDPKAAANLIESHYQTGHKCRLSIRIGEEWLTKEGVSQDSDVQPLKGGASGALKRAAVKFGIGRYLYNLPDIWVPVVKEFHQGMESVYYKGSYYYYVKPDLVNFGAESPEITKKEEEPIPVALGKPGTPDLFADPGKPAAGAPSALSEAELQDLLARISAIIQNNKQSLGMYRQINDQPSSLDKLSKMLGCLYFVAAASVRNGNHEQKIKSVMTTKSFGEMYKTLKDILSDMESGIFK